MALSHENEDLRRAVTKLTTKIDLMGARLDRLARVLDGNGRPPLGERLVHIEGKLRSALASKARVDRLQWLMLTTSLSAVGVLVVVLVQTLRGP